MTTDNDSALLALNGLMNEFFEGNTTNERKRQIEGLLSNFSQQRDCWRQCLYFMTASDNQYVIMYAMSVLESIINKQWIGLEGPNRAEVRSSLNQLLLQGHVTLPSFLTNKLCKLIVDIGRLDWPHFYPDFFTNILQLIGNSATTSLGLIMLQTTSEELACPREDLSMSRKRELHQLLLHQVPTMLHIINGILDSRFEKHQQLVTATPPPSPTHGRSNQCSLSRSPAALFSNSPSPADSILSELFKSPAGRMRSDTIMPLDPDSHKVCIQALSCLAHLFSWIPLSSTISPQLLSTIFHFAAFGCDGSTGSHTPTTQPHSLGVAAMCCINELLSKNCVPAEFEDFLLQMFQQTFYLLQRITRQDNNADNRLEILDECYLEKFTEFLRLFVSIHLRRFESNQQFPVLEFLDLLYKYTFKQPSNEGFFTCLDIWGVFLDYLLGRVVARDGSGEAVLKCYDQALISLVRAVLGKLEFRSNQAQLECLDVDETEGETSSEWQQFLRACLETVARVAELMTGDTLELLYQGLVNNLDTYMTVEKLIETSSKGRRLQSMGESDCRRLHCSMRDLSSLFQAHGRLAHFFIGEHFMPRFNEARILVERLVQAISYGSRLKLYNVDTSVNNVLHVDFIEVHCQALAAVKAYTAWLAQFYVESRPHDEQRLLSNQLIDTMLAAVCLLINTESPAKVSHAASHLLLSVLTTVRPAHAFQLPVVCDLYAVASSRKLQALPLDVELLAYRALSHHLLLPWPAQSEALQDWPARAQNHAQLIKALTSDYCALRALPLADNQHMANEARPVVKKTILLLTDLVEAIAEDGTVKSKQLCYQTLTEPIQVTLGLLPVYLQQADICDVMLGFFLSLFLGLRGQMGVSFTEHVVQTFISLFSREQLTETVLQESTTGNKVIEKLLSILAVIVREPSAAFRAFLPHICSICMQQVYPLIAERSSPDIKPCLYQLLHELLHNNWRYFFKGSVLKSLDSQDDQMENKETFVSIMQAYGQSFLQPDIEVFRLNLESLESLNSKKKLYHKSIFKQTMLPQFLSVLLQVLLHKSHNLLAEEIAITLYNMAAVDFDLFYSRFLPEFLASCEGIDENQRAILSAAFQMDRDLPSFTNSIQQFVNDLHYYRLCNSSLPQGSVKL